MHTNNTHYQNVLAQLDVGDTYIKQLFDYYHQCFLKNDWACIFVESSSLIPQDFKEHSFPCLCNRSIGFQIESRRTLQGGAIRGSLQHDGLLLDTGGEVFRGCVVFPDLDDAGSITSAVGYRFGKRIRKGQKSVIHWQKPIAEYLVTQNIALIQEVIHEKAHF